MRIELVLTGGTIGSASNKEGALDTVNGSPDTDLIRNLYEKQPSYRELVDFKISEPIDTLSENMTLELWNRLITHIKSIDNSKTDGIIITHGTDTIAYTANLMALLFFQTNVPVFLVTSSKPLTNPNANGYDNFGKAVDMLIEGSDSGVYVPFRNRDGKLTVHNAGRLVQSRDLSSDFESAHHKLNNIKEIKQSLAKEIGLDPDVPLVERINQLSGNVLTIAPVPGLDYRNFDLDYVDAVLHRTYHSSTMAVQTANEEKSVIYLKKKCDKKRIPLYFAPVLSERKQLYSSTYEIIRRGIIPLYDMTFEMAYAYLLIKTSLVR